MTGLPHKLDKDLQCSLGKEYYSNLRDTDKDVYKKDDARVTQVWKTMLADEIDKAGGPPPPRSSTLGWKIGVGILLVLFAVSLISFGSPLVQNHPLISSLVMAASGIGSIYCFTKSGDESPKERTAREKQAITKINLFLKSSQVKRIYDFDGFGKKWGFETTKNFQNVGDTAYSQLTKEEQETVSTKYKKFNQSHEKDLQEKMEAFFNEN